MLQNIHKDWVLSLRLFLSTLNNACVEYYHISDSFYPYLIGHVSNDTSDHSICLSGIKFLAANRDYHTLIHGS